MNEGDWIHKPRGESVYKEIAKLINDLELHKITQKAVQQQEQNGTTSKET